MSSLLMALFQAMDSHGGAEPEMLQTEDMPNILCCLCSVTIKPNPSNM